MDLSPFLDEVLKHLALLDDQCQFIYKEMQVFFAIRSFSKHVKSLSRVRLFRTPWTVVYQVPPSMVGSQRDTTEQLD